MVIEHNFEMLAVFSFYLAESWDEYLIILGNGLTRITKMEPKLIHKLLISSAFIYK